MELNEKERAFVRPYLSMNVSESNLWLAGVVAGAVLCVAAAILYFAASGTGMFLLFVLGLVLIDISLDERRKKAMAAILQKYEKALKELEPAGESAHESPSQPQ